MKAIEQNVGQWKAQKKTVEAETIDYQKLRPDDVRVADAMIILVPHLLECYR